MKSRRSKVHLQGFTLIELMVVVTIIGVLMAAGIVAFTSAQRAARDAKRRADIDAIAKAQEQYYQNNGQYFLHQNWTVGIDRLSGLFPTNMTPQAPQAGTYGMSAGATQFCVFGILERPNGNCSGLASGFAGFQCAYVTTGTGAYYCASQRQ